MNRSALKSIVPDRLHNWLGILWERFNRPDAYVVSFPKSGRTWLQMMFSHVIQELTGAPLKDILTRQRQVVRSREGSRLPDIKFGHGYRYKYFCRGHAFPAWFYRNAKVVLLVRDPRDVLVSYYYYQRFQLNTFNGALHEFIEADRTVENLEDHGSRCGLSPILAYKNAWIRNERCLDSLLLMSYEDIHADPCGQLKRLFEFVGLEVAEHMIERAVANASFANMRQIEASGQLDWHALPGGDDSRGYKTRRGTVGSYRDELTEKDIALIDAQINAGLDSRFARYLTSESIAA